MKIMQGDSYGVPFTIKIGDVLITDSNCADVELTIANVSKTYKSGDVKYINGKWYLPLTQEETFAFSGYAVSAQVRVKLNNGDVRGTAVPMIDLEGSISKVVLKDD